MQTPSEFYRQLRPEYFSDSEIISQNTLPREVFTYELSKISTNQKQDEFETLCRRLAEKFITPNLIPQVGPTGGGDGKTDSETYPVSEDIANRWFTPDNGWNKDENWAFAISSKEAWKEKVKSDVKKIVETKRGYTRVYFMSNQLISSKKKKDAQDEFIKEFKIDVVILDREWILEKIYNNKLTDLAVDSLNMSDSFKIKQVRMGSNDTYREKELDILEENISNQNRYSEYDYQLTEDALESAILSRMLEKPRDEVEGKFDRALRFAKRLNNNRQLMRIYYQRAWTYLNWYDDYPLFIENFLEFKNYITESPNMLEIEEYCTLYTSLYSLQALKRAKFEILGIDIDKERDELHSLLNNLIEDSEKKTSSLYARTQVSFLEIIYRKKDINKLVSELSKILELSKERIDYPFETTQKIIEEIFSKIFPNNQAFDKLIDLLAEISSKRSSELEAGFIFLRRASQKLEAGFYKESIVYFGKSIVKIAKEETKSYLHFALLGLGMAYEKQGLIWASNNCYVCACTFAFKFTDEKGIPSEKVYNVVKQLLTNELFIGRIPFILTWHEMLLLFSKLIDTVDDSDDIPYFELCDGTLSVRLAHTKKSSNDSIKSLPSMLEKQGIWSAHNTVLYKQGYIDLIIDDYSDISNEKELDKFFKIVANQPFVEQMIYDTNFMVDDTLTLHSNILGCKFIINFPKDKEMLFMAETLLAFFESFMATSMSNIHSLKEKIIINCIEGSKEVKFEYNEENFTYNFYMQDSIQEINFQSFYDVIMKLTIDILVQNFLMDNIEEHFKSLFETEEVHERLSLILNHRNNILNILGDNPKVLFQDWIDYYKPDEYLMC